MIKYFFTFVFLFLLVSCSSKRESPVIYFSNASEKPITNISCNWVGNVLTLKSLNPGDTRSQSFYIDRSKDFLGLVRISWTNGQGHSSNKEFMFSKKHLPSLEDTKNYSYVQLYFDQYDVEVITSDAADLPGKTRRMDQVLNQYKDNFTKGTPVPASTALIRVEPEKKILSVPRWLANTY